MAADDQGAIEGKVVDEDTIDIDLDEEDDSLREEAVRNPVVVKIKGSVFSIPHVADWEHEAATHANSGRWNEWAEMVLSETDLKTFKAAKLKIYQMERIINLANKRSGTTPGKSSRSSRSRAGTARR